MTAARLCFAPLLLPVGAVEGAGGEIQKERGYGGVDEKSVVMRAGSPVGPQTVDSLDEEKAEDGEEESCDFEPEDAASVNKGAPDGLAELFCSLLYPGYSVLAACGVCGRVLPHGLRSLRGAVAQHS